MKAGAARVVGGPSTAAANVKQFGRERVASDDVIRYQASFWEKSFSEDEHSEQIN